jgi:beta-glucosidase
MSIGTLPTHQRIGGAVSHSRKFSIPLAILLVLPFAASAVHGDDYTYPFLDPGVSDEARIDDLIGRMTLEEKIAAMAGSATVPRLGVVGSPHIEGYHGVAQGGPSNWGRRNPTPTTQFPQAYGLGATWDPELLQRVAAQQAFEARYLFQSPKYDRAGLIVRAPNADLARDPRWGRTEEVYGEDPYLVGTLASAFTRGLQGDDERYWMTAALLKHFLANSHEDERTKTSSDFDERLWREYYARPFEMAIRDGGANALMAAYNAVNGIPAHTHPMLRDIVMGEWGLDGIICTDGGGLRLLVSDHEAYPDRAEAAAATIHAGINHFLDRHTEAVSEALERGLLEETDLDAALRGLFRISLRLGLLDPGEQVPYASIGANDAEPEPWDDPEARAFVREVTRKSIVLIRNDADLLPLDRDTVGSVAVVGPYINTVLLDWYSGTPPYRISPRAGIENTANKPWPAPQQVGVGWVGDMSDAAVRLAAQRDVAIVVVGNHPEANASWAVASSPSEGKEGLDRQEITLPPGQEDFIRRVYEANPNTVVVLVTNFPFALPWAADNVPTILQMTHASQELGNALGDVLFGDADPGGRLVQTWPKSLQQLPPMMDYDLRNGRTYMYLEEEPQFHFGHGLSYTEFEYSDLATSGDVLTADAPVRVTVTIENIGRRAGDDIVQLYVSFPESAVSRPAKALRGFQRVQLEPGAAETVQFTLTAGDLAYWDSDNGDWAVEPGPVDIRVGRSSADEDLVLQARITVE